MHAKLLFLIGIITLISACSKTEPPVDPLSLLGKWRVVATYNNSDTISASNRWVPYNYDKVYYSRDYYCVRDSRNGKSFLSFFNTGYFLSDLNTIYVSESDYVRNVYFTKQLWQKMDFLGFVFNADSSVTYNSTIRFSEQPDVFNQACDPIVYKPEIISAKEDGGSWLINESQNRISIVFNGAYNPNGGPAEVPITINSFSQDMIEVNVFWYIGNTQALKLKKEE